MKSQNFINFLKMKNFLKKFDITQLTIIFTKWIIY